MVNQITSVFKILKIDFTIKLKTKKLFANFKRFQKAQESKNKKEFLNIII
jgi:hypothetical protein